MAASLAQKLQIKPETPLAVVNAPEGMEAHLQDELPENPVSTGEAAGQVRALLVFVHNLDEARRLTPQAIGRLDSEGLLWLAYPKVSSKVKTDVNRDRLREELAFTGWRPVRQVALDETWSAMRYRPE